MLEHLEVSVVPVAEPSHTAVIEADVLRYLDPPLNLVKVPNSPGRTRLRAFRRQRFAVTRDTGGVPVNSWRSMPRENQSGCSGADHARNREGEPAIRATRQSFWTPTNAEGGA